MTSKRHIEDRLLDAVYECVCSVGVRRTTLTDIARRAGVSRMTVYRQFPDVSSMVTALMTREFGNLFRQIAMLTAGSAHARERLVRGIVEATRRLTENPLLTSVLDRDPETLLPYVVERVGNTQKLAESFLAQLIAEGHDDGSIRRGDPVVQARAIYLTAQTFVITHRPATSDVDADELRTELAAVLDGALRPGRENR